MSNRRVEEILGGHAKPAAGLAEGERRPFFARVDGEGLAALVRHWESMPEALRPPLRGIVPSALDDSRVFLNVLLDLGPGEPLLCVEADFPRDRVAPDFRGAWPFAAWWQEELAVFHGVRFEGERGEGGVQWRQT